MLSVQTEDYFVYHSQCELLAVPLRPGPVSCGWPDLCHGGVASSGDVGSKVTTKALALSSLEPESRGILTVFPSGPSPHAVLPPELRPSL